jgi:hypothetical protein
MPLDSPGDRYYTSDRPEAKQFAPAVRSSTESNSPRSIRLNSIRGLFLWPRRRLHHCPATTPAVPAARVHEKHIEFFLQWALGLHTHRSKKSGKNEPMRSRLSVNSSEYIHSTARPGVTIRSLPRKRGLVTASRTDAHAQSCSGFDTAEYDWGRAQLPHQEDRMQLCPLLHGYSRSCKHHRPGVGAERYLTQVIHFTGCWNRHNRCHRPSQVQFPHTRPNTVCLASNYRESGTNYCSPPFAPRSDQQVFLMSTPGRTAKQNTGTEAFPGVCLPLGGRRPPGTGGPLSPYESRRDFQGVCCHAPVSEGR